LLERYFPGSLEEGFGVLFEDSDGEGVVGGLTSVTAKSQNEVGDHEPLCVTMSTSNSGNKVGTHMGDGQVRSSGVEPPYTLALFRRRGATEGIERANLIISIASSSA
jgi:hypothetical protein